MNVAQHFTYIIALYLFYAINDSILKSMMPINTSIFWKNHVSCSVMLRYYITVSNRQLTKTLNQFFDLSRANENLEICMSV